MAYIPAFESLRPWVSKPATPALSPRPTPSRDPRAVVAKRFVFLFHPRLQIRQDLGLRYPVLERLPERWCEALAKAIPTPSISFADAYLGTQRKTPDGWVRIIPVPGRDMLRPSNLPTIRERIEASIDEAIDLGAEIVGLGALTAPATKGGQTLAHRDDVVITNGNAFTAAMTFRLIQRTARMMSNGAEPVVAIIGATGSVGGCTTRLLAKHGSVSRLRLLARHRGRLEALASEVSSFNGSIDVSIDTTLQSVTEADLVVLLTSAADTVLRSEHLKRGAVVIDDTQPRNTDIRLTAERPDVLILDGGLVRVPRMYLSASMDLSPGLSYACMAETMLLALEGYDQGHFALGVPTVEQAEYTMALADKYKAYGFELAPPRSFGTRLGTRDHQHRLARRYCA